MTGSNGEAMTQRDWLSREQVEDMATDSVPESYSYKEWQALCSMALAALDADWHPIETAPKDGTRVDVWVELHGTALTAAKALRFNLDGRRIVNAFYVPGTQGEDGLWCEDHFMKGYRPVVLEADGGGNYRVTHWRPLPPPPQQKERPE